MMTEDLKRAHKKKTLSVTSYHRCGTIAANLNCYRVMATMRAILLRFATVLCLRLVVMQKTIGCGTAQIMRQPPPQSNPYK